MIESGGGPRPPPLQVPRRSSGLDPAAAPVGLLSATLILLIRAPNAAACP
jgi:hypothetical protein